jgi:hypothetical protein
MKKQLQYLKLFLPALFLLIASHSHAQQEFTLTTSGANITSSQALINLPELNGNPYAIINVIPQGTTSSQNSNPLGVWYYTGKWYVFNSNFNPMVVGLIYKVQYFLMEGPNQFLHLVTQTNLGAEGSYIDNPALNNKPNVQFSIMQNHSPDIRAGSWRNPNEAKKGYNASSGKWYITNVNGQPIQKGCAYNIVVSSASGSSTGSIDPIPLPPVEICKCPASLPPNGQATGDLAGMYPNPMVVKLLNRPLSNTPPLTGQLLKWNGTEWSPSNESGNAGNATTYTAGLGLSLNGTQFNTLSSTAMWNASQLVGRDIMTTAPTVGQVLKWGGGAWAPADDNVGTGGTGNSWNVNGANISNTNTGNVGIGTTTPLNKLHVEGATFLNGNVGIGTVTPNAPLQFSNTTANRKIVLFEHVNSDHEFYGFGVNSSTLRYQIPNIGAAHVFFTGTTPAQSPFPSAELFRINGNGNVGVGINDPAFRLDVGNRMRIRSGGNNTVSAGLWLNNNANTEAAFIGMEDDTHVGIYGKDGAGWKFAMNTQTGALKINGTEGTAGQVLTSNGAGSPPTWNQPSSTGGTGIQTFFKKSEADGGWVPHHLFVSIPELNHSVILTKKSRLVISAIITFGPAPCGFDCKGVQGVFELFVDPIYSPGALNATAYIGANFSGPPQAEASAVISNFMVELNPGTHTVEFKLMNNSGFEIQSRRMRQSSIIVIPLE